MNERTNPYSPPYPLPVSLALSLGLRSRRSGSKNRPFASRPSRRTEPATFPSSRTSFHPRVPAARFLARAYSRLRAYYTRVSRFRRVRLSSAHTRTYSQSQAVEKEERRGGIFLSFSLSLFFSLFLSLRVANCRSRFAKPAPKVPPYRSHSLSLVSPSFSLSPFS